MSDGELSGAPRDRYRTGRNHWARVVAEAERRFARVGAARLVVFVAGVVLAAVVVAQAGGLSPAWVLLPLGGFTALVIWHERIARGRDRARRSLNYFERGIERLEHRWMTGGDDGARFRDDGHLYTSDLEIFGPGSLFQLLSTCRTGRGAGVLASWLREPAPVDEIDRRQAAVRDIAGRDALRHELAVVGPDVTARLDSAALRSWAEAPPRLFPRGVAAAAALAGAANLVTIAGGLAGWWPGYVAAISLLVSAVLSASVRGRARATLQSADQPGRDLVLLAELLDRVVGERFEAEWLRALHERWVRTGVTPGTEVRRLARLVDLVDSRRNQLFLPIAGALLLGTQLAAAIERWRARVGPAVVDWLDAVGELEAIVSLGTFAFDHPADAFPTITDGPPRLVARGLAHPLLDEAVVVRNDVALEPPCRLVVVSGSNMSGKSTLLKAIGVNLVLAQAGAPVRATALSSAAFSLGASLVLRDSLLEGRSRFYAEIVRLRDIVALTAGRRPVLFLLDELLSGTNSHDRAIGAAGVLNGLVARGAAGFVTTHDLALTRIATALADQAVNWHLEDRLEAGTLLFDYRLKPGVVRRSNALELMKAVGLDLSGADRESQGWPLSEAEPEPDR